MGLFTAMHHVNIYLNNATNSLADAPTKQPTSGIICFAQPHYVLERFEPFMDNLQNRVTKYSQGRMRPRIDWEDPDCWIWPTENDNLRNEYKPLFPDVKPNISWASEALVCSEPDAINLWLGNSRSVTALHKDNYENLYCQIIGIKHFVLIPPTETACVNEQFIPCAHYQQNMEIKVDWSSKWVPCAIWDPHSPTKSTTT